MPQMSNLPWMEMYILSLVCLTVLKIKLSFKPISFNIKSSKTDSLNKQWSW